MTVASRLMKRGPWLAVGLAVVLAASGVAATLAVPGHDTTVADVRSFRIETRNHVLEPRYASVPPVGGDHAPRWLACGVYDRPVDDAYAVHALEHGAVWITRDPAMAADDVAELARQLPAEGILSPYAGLPGPAVVTVWGRQLVLSGPDDPGLRAFLRRYADGHTAPEAMASCAGGVVAYATVSGEAA
ncbi:DUF3105 domain-containing protein [Nocardioides jiangxiensis]|uniref:DUF3105 domain-containing protein n=1 Tax=Nocardioides jiangxiensis TaxID=3064524 RepID=A0ABT9B5A2_9ACTN|nr:DUF3105 domain-containing protein [Nocardioides sp. WY-20]MDO7869489.1 DUF3105 domain-containing protein [Nocardioides sp. WY-20]